MSSVYVSSEDLNSYAMRLRALNDEVQSVFNEIRMRMQMVAGIWSSPASQALQQQFASLSPVFTQYVEHLNQYAAYLQTTAQAYAENEALLEGQSRV